MGLTGLMHTSCGRRCVYVCVCGGRERDGMGLVREVSSYQLRVPVTADRLLTAWQEEGDGNHAHFTALLCQQVRIYMFFLHPSHSFCLFSFVCLCTGRSPVGLNTVLSEREERKDCFKRSLDYCQWLDICVCVCVFNETKIPHDGLCLNILHLIVSFSIRFSYLQRFVVGFEFSRLSCFGHL